MKMRWGGRAVLMDARVEAERETADEGWPGRRRGGGGQEGREEEKLREPKLQEPSALLQMGWGQKTSTSRIHSDASICPLLQSACHSLYFY